MIFGGDRTELRQMYADAWRKSCAQEVLSPLEVQIAEVIEQHPEYHPIIGESNVEAPFSPDDGQENPFLHMGLHLALREQVSTDRPAGIAAIQRQLLHKLGNACHAVEQAEMRVTVQMSKRASSVHGDPSGGMDVPSVDVVALAEF